MSKKEFEGCYHIHDGYINDNRPMYFNVGLDDLCQGMTERDLKNMYDEIALDEFQNSVFIETRDEDKFVKWALERIAEMGEDK